MTCDSVIFPVVTDAGGGAPQNTWMEVARVDYNCRTRTPSSGAMRPTTRVDFPGYRQLQPLCRLQYRANQYDQNVTINWTHVFSPSVVNTFNIIYNRLNGPNQPLGYRSHWSNALHQQLNSVDWLTGSRWCSRDTARRRRATPYPLADRRTCTSSSITSPGPRANTSSSSVAPSSRNSDNRTFGAYENAVEYLGTSLG